MKPSIAEVRTAHEETEIRRCWEAYKERRRPRRQLFTELETPRYVYPGSVRGFGKLLGYCRYNACSTQPTTPD